MSPHLAYVCENCNQPAPSRAWIFNCIHCGKEVCESCFYSWGTCKECAESRTDEELKALFYELSQTPQEERLP